MYISIKAQLIINHLNCTTLKITVNNKYTSELSHCLNHCILRRVYRRYFALIFLITFYCVVEFVCVLINIIVYLKILNKVSVYLFYIDCYSTLFGHKKLAMITIFKIN